jgi:hypothetical protein
MSALLNLKFTSDIQKLIKSELDGAQFGVQII